MKRIDRDNCKILMQSYKGEVKSFPFTSAKFVFKYEKH